MDSVLIAVAQLTDNEPIFMVILCFAFRASIVLARAVGVDLGACFALLTQLKELIRRCNPKRFRHRDRKVTILHKVRMTYQSFNY